MSPSGGGGGMHNMNGGNNFMTSNMNSMGGGGGQMMGMSQQPDMMGEVRRPPLKLNLTPQERGYYSNMFGVANPSQSPNLSGGDCVVFFRKSGLPVEKLKDIW